MLKDIVKPKVSAMLVHFGQFLSHDLTMTPEQGLYSMYSVNSVYSSVGMT